MKGISLLASKVAMGFIMLTLTAILANAMMERLAQRDVLVDDHPHIIRPTNHIDPNNGAFVLI